MSQRLLYWSSHLAQQVFIDFKKAVCVLESFFFLSENTISRMKNISSSMWEMERDSFATE